MIALDALSAYWIASHSPEDRELNVTLSSQGRNGFKTHVLQLNNHKPQGIEEELQVTTPSPGSRTPGPSVWARTSRPAHPSPTWCPVGRLPAELLESHPVSAAGSSRQ